MGSVQQGTKKGAVSLSLLRALKMSLGGTTPSDHHHRRQVANAVDCRERFSRKTQECSTPWETALMRQAFRGTTAKHLHFRVAELLRSPVLTPEEMRGPGRNKKNYLAPDGGFMRRPTQPSSTGKLRGLRE